MTDTLEWLVEFVDLDKRTVYERFKTVNDAIPFLHKVLGTGQRPRLYKQVPVSLTIDVGIDTPKRRHRKKEGSGAAEQRGETTQDAAAQEPAASPVVAPARNPASPVSPDAGGMVPGRAHNPALAGSIPAPATSLFECEARFDKDPVCPGPAEFDPATRGRFCGFHLAQVPEGHRREMHRLHGHRNRPTEPIAKVA